MLLWPLIDVSGRMFCREVSGGHLAIVGALALPAAVPVEHLVAVRLADRLVLDTSLFASGLERSRRPASILYEMELEHILTTIQIGGSKEPGVFELFVRASHLEHDDPTMRWCLVVGGVKARLPAIPTDGLYEFGVGGTALVAAGTHRGKNLSQILREPLWGPSGALGFATSMEPSVYECWVQGNRAANAARDPAFKRYLELVEAERPLAHVYTRDEHLLREATSRRIFREIMLEESVSRGTEQAVRDRPRV